MGTFLFGLINAIPLVGSTLARLARLAFWWRTLRAPKARPDLPDTTPLGGDAIIRFTDDVKTPGAGLLATGFRHAIVYLYIEDSHKEVGKHEWVRRQRLGASVHTNVARRAKKDLLEALKREDVTLVETKVRLPQKSPWLPRFRYLPGGAGVIADSLNIIDPWVWTLKDIWELERPCTVSRASRLVRLRRRKIFLVALLLPIGWLFWEFLLWDIATALLVLAGLVAAPILVPLARRVYNIGQQYVEKEKVDAST